MLNSPNNRMITAARELRPMPDAVFNALELAREKYGPELQARLNAMAAQDQG